MYEQKKAKKASWSLKEAALSENANPQK